MSDIEFAAGIYWNDKHEKAPDFVIGSISVQPDKFIEWLERQETSDKGYVRLQVKYAKSGKAYVALDNWKPQEKQEKPRAAQKADDFDDSSDIPF